jgi:hypothetical protein
MGIKLQRYISIDKRFELLHEEKKDKQKRMTTLRQILHSRSEKRSENPSIQLIEQCNTNIHILLVKVLANKERANKKLNQPIEVLSEHGDFPMLCGNTDKYGTNINRSHKQSALCQVCVVTRKCKYQVK